MIENFLKDFTVLESIKESVLQILQNENGRFYAELREKKNDNSEESLNMEIVRYIERVKSRDEMKINWEQSKKFYLDEHEELIDMLKKAEGVYSPNGDKIKFAKKSVKIKLNIENQEEKFVFKPNCKEFNLEKAIFISDRYVFEENKIFEIEPIGENYKNILKLNFENETDVREYYLAHFYTYFKNIDVVYEGYKVETVEAEEKIPVIVLEKVDSRQNLYMKISFEAEKKNENLTAEVKIDDEEKKISVYKEQNVNRIQKYADEIEELIKKHDKGKNKNGFFKHGRNFILSCATAEAFIAKELMFLGNRYKIAGSEQLNSYKIKSTSPVLFINFKNGIDFIGEDSHVEIEGEKISIQEAMDFYSKNSYIMLSDGTKAVVDKEYMDKLERLFNRKSGKKLTFFDFHILKDAGEWVGGEGYQKAKDVFDGFNKIMEKSEKIPEIATELRDYQEYGYRWMKYIYDNDLGGCLADDMGLGKTVQAIAVISEMHLKKKKNPTLIVLPKSLVFNWESEISKLNSNLKFYTYYGPERDIKNIKGKDIVITTYGTVRNDIEILNKIKYESIFLDEAQSIKNVNSMIFKNITTLDSKSRFALSGTPVENNLFEVYAIFKFLNPDMFGTAAEFSKDYAIPIQKEENKSAEEELRRKIYPFILRRTKKDVLQSLPDKIEKVMFVEMDEKHREYYEERRKYYASVIKKKIEESGISKSKFFVLQALSELRQIATNPEAKTEGAIVSSKQEMLIENIADAVSNDHRVLVFTNYLSVVDNITKKLDEYGIENLHMTGKTADRREVVEKFQNNKNYKVLVMTLKTGGVGLNLTTADMVFIYDPWWNKSAEMQAVDRSHRIGQDKTVFSYKFIAKNTIEEKILTLQQKKSTMFSEIIKSDGNAVKLLSNEEIEYILGE